MRRLQLTAHVFYRDEQERDDDARGDGPELQRMPQGQGEEAQPDREEPRGVPRVCRRDRLPLEAVRRGRQRPDGGDARVQRRQQDVGNGQARQTRADPVEDAGGRQQRAAPRRAPEQPRLPRRQDAVEPPAVAVAAPDPFQDRLSLDGRGDGGLEGDGGGCAPGEELGEVPPSPSLSFFLLETSGTRQGRRSGRFLLLSAALASLDPRLRLPRNGPRLDTHGAPDLAGLVPSRVS